MVKAKKSLGQHFLTDLSAAERIVNALDEVEDKCVLEIGPGEGVLTQYLVQKDIDLSVIELDRESISHLNARFPYLGEKLIHADFLKWTIPTEQITLIGNFPYNISSQIVFKMIEHRQTVKGLIGMFQKEVAERIVSPPGSRAYGILSVFTQAYYEGEYLFTIEPEAFRPPPKVRSGVIRLRRKEDISIDCDEKAFVGIVKLAFNQRRKMMRNSLKSMITEENEPTLGKYLTQRPEQLSPSDFLELTRLLKP